MSRSIPFQSYLFAVLFMATNATFADNKSSRTFRILFLDRPPNAPKTLYLFDGQSSKQVELPKMNFSPVYQLADGDVAITLLTEPVDNPLKIPTTAPKLIISEEMQHFYLIVTSDPENPITPVRMKSIAAGNDKIGNGETLWFNLTAHTIAGQLGTQRLLINPMSQSITKPPVTDAGSYDVQIAYRVDGESDIYPICKTAWSHNPQSRDVAFIFLKPNSRTPRIYSFRDSRDAPDQSTQAHILHASNHGAVKMP